VNRSMSGLFRIITYECNLSKGVFTVDIKSIREIPVNRNGNKPVVEQPDQDDVEGFGLAQGGDGGFIAGGGGI